MNPEFYRELWRLRFNKMLRLELQAAEEYRSLLDECAAKHKDHAITPHLSRIIKDETRHARLVRELLRILKRQKK